MTQYGYQYPSFSSQNRPYQYTPRTPKEIEELRLAEIEQKKQEFARQQAREPKAILQGYLDKAKNFTDQASFGALANSMFGPLSQKIDDQFGPTIDQTQEELKTTFDPYRNQIKNQLNNFMSPNQAVADPVLMTTANTQDSRLQEVAPPPIPALFSNVSMPVDQFESTSTDRKRDRTTFGEFLANRPGVSDRLIRMGSAMQAASPRGLNAALAAMGQEYANVNADQRAQELALAEAQAKANAGKDDNEDLLNDFQSQIFKYDKALEDFAKISGGVTGPFDGTIGSMIDSSGLGNAEREAFRIRLRKIIVDETLLNTANTKGAISDREMALFQSSVPSLKASEEVWIKWLTARRDNLIELQQRIRSGRTVSRDADIGFANTYTIADENNTASNDNITDDDEALFDF